MSYIQYSSKRYISCSRKAFFVGFIILIDVLFQPTKVLTQSYSFGIPSIQSHSKKEYQAGSQNWDIQYHSGHMLFANNGGLLAYDGVDWKITGTPNNTILRSISISDHGEIYIGAQNEIGFFDKNDEGSLVYTNLKDSIGTITNLDEIWHMAQMPDALYFSANNFVYQFQQEKGSLTKFGDGSYLSHMAKVNDEIWFHHKSSGIRIINEYGSDVLPGSDILKDFNIVAFLSKQNGQVFILTESNGIYIKEQNKIVKWSNSADDFLLDKRINTAIYHESHGLIIGTYLGGIIMLDDGGKARYWIDKQNGLLSNRINKLFLAPNGILWAATNNGIEEINLKKSNRRFFPDNELQGAIYDVARWKGHLFFASTNGLYKIRSKDYYDPLKKQPFELVKGSHGECWGLDIINDRLYLSQHGGLFEVNQKFEAKNIFDDTGTWKLVKIKDDHAILGTYNGLILYRIMPDHTLKYLRKVKNFKESARVLIVDKFDHLWVSHPYKNVYRFKFDDDFENTTLDIYNKDSGFRSDQKNYVFNLDNTCYLTNETGIYKYDEKKDSFEISELLNAQFDAGNHVRKLSKTNDEVWAISNDHTVRFDLSSSGLVTEIQANKLLNLKAADHYVGGFESFYTLDDQTIFILTAEGVLEQKLHDTTPDSLRIKFNMIKTGDITNITLYDGFGSWSEADLSNEVNGLRLSFGSIHPQSFESLEYSVKTDNDDWSDWSYQNTKEYTNLKSGDHSISVKARNNSGSESPIIKFEYHKTPPWYQSIWAYLFYTLIFLSILLGTFFLPRKKYLKDNAALAAAKKKTEDEIEMIKKEKLEDEIKFKNKELANSTFHLMQKRETINKLRDKLNNINKKVSHPDVKKELKEIKSILRSDLHREDDWDKFSIHFDQVHQDFIKKLQADYPQLSVRDHKLCAYLKMNLSSKEIAPLLNISIRGVEISRYRLRKKLELDRAINLNDFFNKRY